MQHLQKESKVSISIRNSNKFEFEVNHQYFVFPNEKFKGQEDKTRDSSAVN
jgi:hypothetical protein